MRLYKQKYGGPEARPEGAEPKKDDGGSRRHRNRRPAAAAGTPPTAPSGGRRDHRPDQKPRDQRPVPAERPLGIPSGKAAASPASSDAGQGRKKGLLGFITGLFKK